jgi:hypothetical protein
MDSAGELPALLRFLEELVTRFAMHLPTRVVSTLNRISRCALPDDDTLAYATLSLECNSHVHVEFLTAAKCG